MTTVNFVFPYGTLYLVLSGFLIGIIVSAPMGPVGVLCVQRTLSKGRWYGFATGIGAACSDMIYALITGYGMSFVGDIINNERNLFLLQMVGSAMLLAFGVYSFTRVPEKSVDTKPRTTGTLTHNFWTGLGVTLSNPLIIPLFVALFAQFAFVVPNHFIGIALGFAAIFGGALFWWFVLTWGIDRLRPFFQERGLLILNRTIGVLVIAASLYGFALTVFGLGSLTLIPH
ncbi:MAG: LysE family transporter [Bacteroidaceae bacterium]|nr:LysE family transporter [Bacteroidaceae bacterium]